MKQCVLVFLWVAFLSIANAQNYRVKSIVELTRDTKAKVDPRFDADGKKCSLVRLNIPSIQDITFVSPIVGTPITEPGEYAVYVSSNTKNFRIICDKQEIVLNFSNFDITLEPMRCYRAVIVKSSVDNNLNFAEFSISANYDDDILLIDGYPIGQLPLYVDDIQTGSHTFSVPNTNGRVLKDSVIDITENSQNIVLKLTEETQTKELIERECGFNGGDTRDIREIEPIWANYHIVERNGKKGLADRANLVVPCNYDYIYECNYYDEYYFYDTCVYVERDGRSGLYKIGTGEIVLFNTEYWNWYYYGNGIFRFWNNNDDSFVYFDVDQKISIDSRKYKNVWCYQTEDNDVFYIAENSNGDFYILKRNGNIILTIPRNSHGQWFDMAYDYHSQCGIWWWVTESGEKYYEAFDLYGGTHSLPTNYVIISREFYRGLIGTKDKYTKKYGYINSKGKIVIPFIFQGCGKWSHGTVVLEDENYEYVFNTEGVIIMQTKPGFDNSYKDIEKYGNGLLRGETFDGKMCILDSLGNNILPTFDKKDYKDFIVDENPFMLYLFTDNSLIGYNVRGELFVNIPIGVQMVETEYYKGDTIMANILEHSFPFICRFEARGEKMIVRKTRDVNLFQVVNPNTNKYGFMSANGELLTSCIYDDFYQSTNNEPIPDDYDSYEEYLDALKYYNNNPPDEDEQLIINTWIASEGYGIINVGGAFGFIDSTGKVVVPLKYSFVTPFVNGISYVKDASGKWSKIFSKNLK